MVNQVSTNDARFCPLCQTKHIFGACIAFDHPRLQRRLMSRICSEVQRFHKDLETIKNDPSPARIHSLGTAALPALTAQLASMQSACQQLQYPETDDAPPTVPPAPDFVPGRS
jgi:hypothetical protein